MDKKKLSNKHEKDIADFFEGKVQIASGAIPLVGLKGDVVTSDSLIECKATEKAYYSLKKTIVKKIEKEALHCGRTPLLAIRVSGVDFILYRVFDFDDKILEEHLLCKESMKLSEEFLKTLYNTDTYMTIKICNTLWAISSLRAFSSRYLEVES